jgi:hypothetical protein
MTMGTFIGRYNNPAIGATMFSMDGDWTVDKAIAEAPNTLFKDYKNINQK